MTSRLLKGLVLLLLISGFTNKLLSQIHSILPPADLAATTVICPSDTTILCDYFKDNLWTPLIAEEAAAFDSIFGKPDFGVTPMLTNASFFNNIDQCTQGIITRTWNNPDSINSPVPVCVQNISVQHVSDWVVKFPADIFVECGEMMPETGEPEIFAQTCELIAVSYEDDYFSNAQDACFKINRSWMVINWCVVNEDFDDLVDEDSEAFLNIDLDGQNGENDRIFQDGLNLENYDANAFINGAQPDGIIKFQQIIKGNDSIAPVLACPTNLNFCILENDCDVNLQLPLPSFTDCNEDVDFTVTTSVGNGQNLENISVGIYEAFFGATDICGNYSVCQTNFQVNDCIFPTAFCLTALVVELEENGEYTLEAQNFNSGSFDNCSTDLFYSFSPDINDTSVTFDCTSMGLAEFAEIFVTDAADNQTYCETVIFVIDNGNSCGSNPSISGKIKTENGSPINGVSINLSGSDLDNFTTSENGEFLFEDLENGGNYSLSCEKDYNYLNGVTTFDLVVISNHLLGTELMTSPYQLIAADANKSNSITTLDLVQIRKLVLHIEDTLANNTSWRFFDENHVFTNPVNPFANMPSEVLQFNFLNEEITNADFIGVKIGDVNHNVNPLELTSADDRNHPEKISITTDNQQFTEDEIIEISFQLEDKNLLGYQFTLDFDKEKLKFIEIKEALAKQGNFGFSHLQSGAITTSWNGETTSGKSTLFTIVFKAKRVGELRNALTINSKFTKAEAYNSNLEIANIELAFLEKNILEFIQVAPNPFADKTVLKYQLPSDETVQFKIQDITGKIVFSTKKEGKSGLNQLVISKQDLGSAGMYFYKMEFSNQIYSGKMILKN